MKSFNHFLVEASQEQPKRVAEDAMMTFGRYNPPHLGHGRVLDHASNLANSIGDNQQADQIFHASKSQDRQKNPLPFELKIAFLQKMFPKHAKKWDTNPEIRTVLGAAAQAGQQGYKNLHFVGGDDRRQGMEDLLRKYNGQLYDFDNIYSHSAGERNEDSEDPIAKLSASGQRRAAFGGDFEKFREGLPGGRGFTMKDARDLFEKVRMFGEVNEEYFEDGEYLYEMYKRGHIYRVNEEVEQGFTGLRGTIIRTGANHLICVTEEGLMFKSFVSDVYYT